MTISALDKDTAKLITTTQIITSVSIAVKELLENALDADARNIEISLVDNGCTLIEVKDNGCGITKEDASYMALPSHTSKITTFNDLDSLKTYGFRGEALHALSAVSDVTVISKTEQDEVAVCYNIDHHGRVKKTEHCHRATGTTVQVKELFKQLPVRRQIITNPKKATQDVKILESLIKSYGICKFCVRICYKVDNVIKYAKPSTTTLEEAATYTLSKKVTSNMSWINIESTQMNAKLMVPSKELQNVSEVFQPGAQYIFVNNRPIKNKELEKVLTSTILKALNQDSSRKKPIFLLYILTDAGNIDVNLEPNKTCILFKEEKIILDTVQSYLENFYGVQKEVEEENVCDQTTSGYQDYTQPVNISDVDEQPAFKKRKLEIRESALDNIEKVTCIPKPCTDHARNNEPAPVSEKEKINEDRNDEKCQKNIDFNIQLPALNLSDSDTNDSQQFSLRYDDARTSNPTNADESPPLEFSQNTETLSQLPYVDLGDDFILNDFSDTDTIEKENIKQSANVENVLKEIKSEKKKCVTLKEWSKGHVSGLQGGTDVQPYVYPKSDNEGTHNKNVCPGFLKFMKHIRSQVTEQNPNSTAAQIANIMTNLWKKISSEERGYYRDLAREEKEEREAEKEEIKEKRETNVNKNRNRLLKALEKMKTMNLESNKNLVMRTIVPWDMDLKKVNRSFLNNSTCKNNNVVVGLVRPDLWIVHKSSHIWVLDAATLKKEFGTNTSEDTAENMEQLLNRWFSIKDDLSLLHPIHLLPQNK